MQVPMPWMLMGGAGTMHAEAMMASSICWSLVKRLTRTFFMGSGGL